VADLQSSDDEAEEEANSANTTSIVSGLNFRSDASLDDSFMTVQKDRTDNSTSADTVRYPVSPSNAHTRTRSGRLLSGVLPPEVRATLDQWYAERGIHQPPPCALPEYIIRPVFTSDAARFARYEHEDGEQLEAMLYTLPELAPRFEQRCIVVVQGPMKGPFIIRNFDRVLNAKGTVPCFVWNGLNCNDPLGWESKPSIRKVIMPMMPAWNHGENRSEVLKHNMDAVGSEGDPKLAEVEDHVKAKENPQPYYAREDDWQQSPEPEEPLMTIPEEIRTLLHRWYSHRGSKQPPPCAIEHTQTKYLNTSKAGNTCVFTDRDGVRMKLSVCILPEFADASAKRKYIIVAEGQGRGPFIIGFAGHRGSNATFLYHIWKGLDTEDPDGWESVASIYKTADFHGGSVGELKSNLADFVSGGVFHDLDGDLNNYSSGIPVQGASQPYTVTASESTGRIMSYNIDSDRVADEDPLPQNIKQLIHQWCDRVGPSVKLESLPFATGNHSSTLTRTPTGRPVVWEYKDGSKLTVSMYPLRETEFKLGGGGDKNRVIVAQGPNLEPSVIAYLHTSSRGKQVSYRIWKGIGGDKDGFESGSSVKKIFPAKIANVGKTARKNGAAPVNGGNPLPRFQDAEPDVKSAESDPTPHKRKRPDDDSDSILTTGQSPSKQLRTQDRNPPPITRPPPSAITEHIQNNTVFLFYSPSHKNPRVRLFSACNTVQKLFAQALAGDLFDDSEGTTPKGSPTGGRVLSFRFGGIRKEIETSQNILVIEGDKEDFEALVRAIEARDWWTSGKSEDLVEGSGAVEVRAKR
jgi:hypothetical protein